MLQNAYNLSDLVDLALRVPEVGAVNFNILYIVLQTIIGELGLKNVKPWCHIENPVVAKTALTRAKLKNDVRKSHSESSVMETPKREDSPSRLERCASSDAQLPAPRSLSPIVEDIHEGQEISDSASTTNERQVQENPIPIQTKDETSQTEVYEREDFSEKEINEISSPEEEDSQTLDGGKNKEKESSDSISKVVEEPDTSETDRGSEVTPPKQKKQGEKNADLDEVSRELKEHRETLDAGQQEKKTYRDTRQARTTWQFTNLESRVSATEEGLMRLTDIIDIITDKIRRSEARKKPGGPKSAELEAIDDRIIDLEEANEVCVVDHATLTHLEGTLSQVEKDFQEIQAVGRELQQMKIDISRKADSEEIGKKLDLKADLELVSSKVDQIEFETAIEELGEAIGLLGIKFQKKYDEWDERAVEMREAINGKMTKDVFDEAGIKIEKRITALMLKLTEVMKVIEDLLYPDSSGVTKCIACRRQAGISGRKYINAFTTPKREFKSSSDTSNEEIKRLWIDAKRKKQKIEQPPYTENKEALVSFTEESNIAIHRQIKLAPINKTTKSRINQLPKVMTEIRIPHRELTFTNRKLAELQKKTDISREELTKESSNDPEVSTKSGKVSHKSSSHISSDLDMISESSRNVEDFAPIRMMPDPLRREIWLTPTALKDYKPKMALSPLQSPESRKESSSSSTS